MKAFQCMNRELSRISRLDYWMAYFGMVFLFGFIDILLFCSWQTFGKETLFLGIFCTIKLFQVIYMYLLTLKRFHDVGYATWCFNICILLLFVAIGFFLIFLVTIAPSDKDNAWGKNISKLQYEKDTITYRE